MRFSNCAQRCSSLADVDQSACYPFANRLSRRSGCAAGVFGAVNDPWGFRWPIDYEDPKGREEFRIKMGKQIREIKAKKVSKSARDPPAGGRD